MRCDLGPEKITEAFGEVTFMKNHDQNQDETVFITEKMPEVEIDNRLKAFKIKPLSKIRVLESE
jgi:phenolic acid decarboxylase